MKNTPPMIRALYIVLIPVVLLIILLNTGWLQRHLPAAKVAERSYTTVEYDFYYFDAYNAFLEEHEEDLGELGYDVNTSARSQDYDEEMSWQDYFLSLCEKEMSEVEYFHEKAESEGYEFSETDLKYYEEQMSKNLETMEKFGLKEDNFYISYYGRGMTGDVYEKELKYKSEAYSYRDYLIENYEASPEEVEGYLEENKAATDYKSVNLSLVTATAIPDRTTGEIGSEQIDALSKKMSGLKERYEGGEDFSTLQQSYSDNSLGDESGDLNEATEDDLPEILKQDLLETDQDALKTGDTMISIDESLGVGYFTLFRGFGEDGNTIEANAALGEVAIDAESGAALDGDYAVKRNRIGMSLAAN